jgi:hypothetical protein
MCFILSDLKCHVSVTSSSINHLSTLIVTKQHIRNFVGVWELVFVAFGGFFFGVLDPLNSIPFFYHFYYIKCINKRGSNFV